MAKTEFLQIRLTPESRDHLSRVAEADHLDESTWARRAILKALERWDAESSRENLDSQASAAAEREQRLVAESEPAAKRRARSVSKSRTESTAKKRAKSASKNRRKPSPRKRSK